MMAYDLRLYFRFTLSYTSAYERARRVRLGRGRGHHRSVRGGAQREAGLVEQERAVRYRRVLQGRIDLMRAELVQREAVALAPEELVRTLMGDWRP